MTSCDSLLAAALEFHNANKFTEADAIYRRIVKEFPGWAPGLWNYARMLHSFPHIKEALHRAAQLYSATLKADGDFCDLKAEAFNGLGTIMLRWGRIDEGMECFRRTLALNPDHPHAHVNLGLAYRAMGDLTGASIHQTAALWKDPNHAEAHFESAFIRLTMGDLVGGFKEYEWRWKTPQFISARLNTERPRWEGENLNGRTIMLAYEQGLGDAIMFVRYAAMIKDVWPASYVRVWVPPELVPLMWWAKGVDESVNSEKDNDEEFDYHIPMLSLPRIFGTSLQTIPADTPYITLGGQTKHPIASRRGESPACPPSSGQAHEHTKTAHGECAGQPYHGFTKLLRLGLVWAGRKEHSGDRWRSINIDLFKPLLEVPGIECHSLQFGERAREADKFLNINRVSEGFKDFTDTARALADIDLLISVDTSVIHLAGAMGVKTWALIPFSPDWRWMLSGETTPWYPTLRLFRQDKRDDWATVIERVRNELYEITSV